MAPDTRNIGEISADISDILILGRKDMGGGLVDKQGGGLFIDRVRQVEDSLEALHHVLKIRIKGGCRPPHEGMCEWASEWAVMSRYPKTDPRFVCHM